MLCGAANTVEELGVRVGDSSIAVRNHLGEPRIEFPLKGQLVQDYGHCIITSSNGVVTSVKLRNETKTQQEPEKSRVAPTIKSLTAKAESGDAEAQYCLGYCYQTGEAVPRNMVEAVRWYTLAAMQGYMPAQHNLGVIYMNGDGVSRDYEQAYTWALLAQDNGNSELANILIRRISTDQAAAGSLRAQRIRDGVEEIPYGTPDETSTVAKQQQNPSDSSAD